MLLNKNAKPLPGIFISKNVVNERVNNFQSNKLPLLTNAIGKPDTKSGWYSIEQFEELMREMYYLNADGVRLYFGAYSNDAPEYAGQLTIIFVPTYTDIDTGAHTDIIIEGEELEERLKAESIASRKIRKDGDMGVLKNLDTLSPCPPDCLNHTPLYPF